MENELLKQINRELKVTSLENSEKKSAKNKDEADDNEKKEQDEVLDDEIKDSLEDAETDKDSSDEDIEAEKAALDDLNDVDKDVEDIASEQTDDIKNDVSEVVLSSAPELLNQEDVPVERDEISEPVDASGILKDYKIDKTSDFIDPDGNDVDNNRLKVVDTALGTFTILNSDDKNVLLLDSNKQKIQISIEDFNNLHPFEIRDEVLADPNSFTDAFERDIEIKKKKKEMDAEESGEDEEMSDETGFEEEPEEEPEEENIDLGGFGESLNHKKAKKIENRNLISEIQKGLSEKQGVVETIRSSVRGKNRCILMAKQTKATKDIHMNEAKPKSSDSMRKLYRNKKANNTSLMENKKKKEATQVSDIAQTPRGLFSDDDNFDLHNFVTIKDGKYVLVKLEGKDKTAYLKLLPKSNISINELKFILNDVVTFNESLKKINRCFTLIEKEVVAMKTKKYEAEEVKDVELEEEDGEELEEIEDDVEVEEDDDASGDVEAVEVEEVEAEEAMDSVPFSVEINGVRYSGTLYAEKDAEEDEEDEEDHEDEEEELYDDDYSDLILQSEDDIDDLDFPNDLDIDDEIIDADVELENVRYNVSFHNVKKECIKRAKLEMRKHNKVGAWNALVRGAESIDC